MWLCLKLPAEQFWLISIIIAVKAKRDFVTFNHGLTKGAVHSSLPGFVEIVLVEKENTLLGDHQVKRVFRIVQTLLNMLNVPT